MIYLLFNGFGLEAMKKNVWERQIIEETKKAPPGRCHWFDGFGLVLNYRAAV
jgi:uncharacterized protein YodC (DUF2158 family)